MLALASDDHHLTVSNCDGDTLKQFSVLGDPSDVQFSEMKADERSSFGDNTVSNIVVLAVTLNNASDYRAKVM